MSNSSTIEAKRLSDGTLVRVMPDGSTQPLIGDTDWARLEAMTEEEILAAALSDPDNPPLTEETAARWKRVPRTKTMRRALKLTQDEFSARYRIPVATLMDWEEERSEPDQTARAYLAVIAADPEGVARLLTQGPRREAAE